MADGHTADERPRPPVGLYLHVPFCVSLCPYCDFVVVTGRDATGPQNRIAQLVAALHVEIDLRADAADAADAGIGARPPLGSVYLGGGTPSLLSGAQVGSLLEHVTRRFGIARAAEITLEANPGTRDLGDLRAFRAAGVTRLSIGVQSLVPLELARLGRRHTPEDVRDAVRRARRAGFRSLSLDLLTDIPGQTPASWAATLDDALRLGPDHLSIYLLTLEDPDADGLTTVDGDHLPMRAGARRWRALARTQQNDDRAIAMDAITGELLASAGLARYELSNHARPGHESRHNLAYWHRDAIEAVGPGAHAFDGVRTRRWNAARLDRYLDALLPTADVPPALPPGGTETIEDRLAHAEATILALRLTQGIPTTALDDPVVGQALAWGLDLGLIRSIDDRLSLSDSGRLLSNEVFVRLLPDVPLVVGSR